MGSVVSRPVGPAGDEPMAQDEELSAQVIFKAADGTEPAGEMNITASNIASFLPDPDAVERARDLLVAMGFKVSPVFANSLAISASAATFEKAFGVTIVANEQGVMFETAARKKDLALTERSIPAKLQSDVYAITFGKPPDFGPQQFHT